MRTTTATSMTCVVEDPNDGSGFDDNGVPVDPSTPFEVWLYANEDGDTSAWVLSADDAERLGAAMTRAAADARARKATT